LECLVRRHTYAAVAVAAAAATVLSACGSSSSGSGASPSSSSSLSGSINVFAAASLTGTFTQLGKQFEAAHPGTKVAFNFGPSSGLATQITQGDPADVFASAAPANMDTVVKAGAASSPTNFASNVMEIAVPPGNPGKITSLNDLARSSEKVVLCSAPVPCGATARKVFENAGITVNPVSNEVDVKSTLSKVELGSADAGVVYVTDVKAAGAKVRGIEIAANLNASTEYPIAALSSSKDAALAKAFVSYVLSADGQSVLTRAGFLKP
jgi:molybdate transport system substrate-binding protein